MDFKAVTAELMSAGYRRAAARAKIAHDVVLSAIRAAGMKERITIKGGVVMSGMTKAVRRATMDMDADFVRYSLSDDAIEKFVRKMNAHSDCTIELDGPIADLRQQEYRGKRIYLRIADEHGSKVLTKVDLGVHAKMEVKQRDFKFDIVAGDKGVRLLANSKEQIFVEKLKSLLRLGTLSSRYKDVYDMYYLIGKMNRAVFRAYLGLYIYRDPKMRERSPSDIAARLRDVFSDRTFRRQLRNRKFAWLDVSSEAATSAIVDFILKAKVRANEND